ncbi:MAG: hypothetical protein ABI977_13240, partial [Acidobacteriota bacterium]
QRTVPPRYSSPHYERIGDMLKHFLIEFLKDEAGQSIVEYTLLMTLIGATTVFMLTLMGVSIGRMIGVNMTYEDYTTWAYEKFKIK